MGLYLSLPIYLPCLGVKQNPNQSKQIAAGQNREPRSRQEVQQRSRRDNARGEVHVPDSRKRVSMRRIQAQRTLET